MLSANAIAALEIACPQNRGSQVGGAGTDGAEIANAINANSGRVAADVAAVSAPAAVDLPTAEALANANKAAINAILAGPQSRWSDVVIPEEQMGKKVDLTKSIDSMIDDLFADKVKKSDDSLHPGKMSNTADEAVNQAPKGQKDEARGAGRPAQISEVPQIDTDGKRAGKYDDDIAQAHGAEENEEAKKQADAKRSDQTMGRQEAGKEAPGMAKSISESEYAEFQAFKKAQATKAQEETLRKAQEQNRDLIKSAVKEATSAIAKENEELRKSLKETNELVKAMAERPQRRKSIDGLAALEKSQSDQPAAGRSENFTKSEMLDVAEELVAKSTANKDMTFQLDHLIELENTGFIFDKRARAALEDALKRK